jgi:phosphohistidine phosphatase
LKEISVRTLSLLRHAKSSWDDEALADFDRPLAPRGEAAAPLMGRHMRDIGLRPDLVICSPSARTRRTAALALKELAVPKLPIVYDEAIYEAGAGSLLACLQRVDQAVGHVLMIGHNPGLQRLVLLLADRRLDGESASISTKLPTGALVVLDLDIDDWSSAANGCATVTHFATPRGLNSD